MTPRERAATILEEGFATVEPVLIFYVEDLIRAAVAEEREACAKIAAEMYAESDGLDLAGASEEISKAIRSRT